MECYCTGFTDVCFTSYRIRTTSSRRCSSRLSGIFTYPSRVFFTGSSSSIVITISLTLRDMVVEGVVDKVMAQLVLIYIYVEFNGH